MIHLVARSIVTMAAVLVDSATLYFGTLPGPSFVHRWVLMAVGICSGIAWTLAVRHKTKTRSSPAIV